MVVSEKLKSSREREKERDTVLIINSLVPKDPTFSYAHTSEEIMFYEFARISHFEIYIKHRGGLPGWLSQLTFNSCFQLRA